ncbi:hypothetical protein [Phyllobacterium sp. OV277]|uniref:hypothetical protein n=1 Tax=Phyllobacterium sp. OV277 TaxID=1882772 RepID=UPI001114452C|nr:hypothetical protein [Phyllobacterium sp. OV277]
MMEDNPALHSRHLGMTALLKSYWIFVFLVGLFNVFEYQGYAVLVMLGTIVFSLPAMAVVIALYFLFPKHFNRHYLYYCLGIPILCISILLWGLGKSDTTVTCAAIIGLISLPTCAIYFMRQEIRRAKQK